MKKSFKFFIINTLVTILISSSFSYLFLNYKLKNFKAESYSTTQNVYIEESNLINSIEKVSPAVVSIIAKKELQQYYNPFGFFNFFDENFNTPPSQTENGKKTKVGGGTGFIIDSSGLVLTNKHVVSDNTAEYSVIFSDDNTEMFAEVLSLDPFTDLAVIQLYTDEGKTKKPTDLPLVELGDSSSLKVGSQVIAIGNALSEFSNTTTYGIISGLSRNIQAQDASGSSSKLSNLLQTDASINPGNSGGALIDVAGNLIGVNTAIFSQSGGSLGIGFAIPAKVCQQVLNSILKDGRVVRGWLGISLVPPTQEDVLAPKQQIGVVVADVLKNGPAASAGIKIGDKIIQVNNQQITSASHLINYVALQAPNSEINVMVERDGKQQNFVVTVGERKNQNTQSQFIPLPKQ